MSTATHIPHLLRWMDVHLEHSRKRWASLVQTAKMRPETAETELRNTRAVMACLQQLLALTTPDDGRTVVLDTETTGLNPHEDRVVEIALISLDGSVLLNSLVNPGRSIPSAATAIHGITDDQVAGAPTLAQLTPQLRSHIAGASLVIYNAAFDTRFLPAEVTASAARVHCAMQAAQAAIGQTHWPRLNVAAAWAGHNWGQDRPHRALADAAATLSVWQRICSQRSAAQ